MPVNFYSTAKEERKFLAYSAMLIYAVISATVSTSIIASMISMNMKIALSAYMLYIVVIATDIVIMYAGIMKIVKEYHKVSDRLIELKYMSGVQSTFENKNDANSKIKLNEKEEMIIELLRKNSGRTTQNVLVKSTGLSPASVSRLLLSLENKDIIERKRKGMTNEILLKR
ncbi:MAG: helix-turn-helix transcriptional regulator [Thermoplasmata archaeon]